MDKWNKADIAIFFGCFCSGGTACVPLLFATGPFVVVALKYLGLLAAGVTTGFAGIIGKYLAEEFIKNRKRKKYEREKRQRNRAA